MSATCTLCSQVVSGSTFNSHTRTCSSRTRFGCNDCFEIFERRTDLRAHRESLHSPQDRNCDLENGPGCDAEICDDRVEGGEEAFEVQLCLFVTALKTQYHVSEGCLDMIHKVTIFRSCHCDPCTLLVFGCVLQGSWEKGCVRGKSVLF